MGYKLTWKNFLRELLPPSMHQLGEFCSPSRSRQYILPLEIIGEASLLPAVELQSGVCWVFGLKTTVSCDAQGQTDDV